MYNMYHILRPVFADYDKIDVKLHCGANCIRGSPNQ